MKVSETEYYVISVRKEREREREYVNSSETDYYVFSVR
jgi:hypothetical protein